MFRALRWSSGVGVFLRARYPCEPWSPPTNPAHCSVAKYTCRVCTCQRNWPNDFQDFDTQKNLSDRDMLRGFNARKSAGSILCGGRPTLFSTQEKMVEGPPPKNSWFLTVSQTRLPKSYVYKGYSKLRTSTATRKVLCL